ITFLESKKISKAEKIPLLIKKPRINEEKKRSRVLIEDDNEHVRNSIANLLHQEGYQIKTAANGLRAIHICKTFKPNVALIDIGLPDINGYKVAKILRKEYQNKKEKITLIAFTG